MSRIKNLLFDLDGTLTDPFIGITGSIRYALEKVGAPVPQPQELAWCIGPPLGESFEKLLHINQGIHNTDSDILLGKQKIEEAIAYYREIFSTQGLYQNTLYPHIPETLEELKNKGYWISLATSKPRIYAIKILDHFGLTDFFHHIHGSELDGTNSQKTELISCILEEHGLHPGQTAMIGDRKHDMIGAMNNTILPVGVLWGYGSREELEGSGADVLVERPGDLVFFDQVSS